MTLFSVIILSEAPERLDPNYIVAFVSALCAFGVASAAWIILQKDR